MLRFVALAVFAFALGSAEVTAQVKLELKFPSGSTQTYELENKVQQTLTLAGMDIRTKATTFLTMSKSIGQRSADGLLKIEDKISVLQSEIDIQGIKLQFDSTNPDKKADFAPLEPLMERLRVTFKHPVTFILDAMNNLKEVKFPEGVAESVDASNKSLFDVAKRKKAAEDARAFLPDEAVKAGDTWERSSDADLGGGQNMAFRTKYTYVGTIDNEGQTLDKITATVFEVSYSVDQANAALKVTKSDLKIAESDVTILFDRARGAVQTKTSKLRIQGPLTLVINAMELDGMLDLTLEDKAKLQK